MNRPLTREEVAAILEMIIRDAKAWEYDDASALDVHAVRAFMKALGAAREILVAWIAQSK